MPPRSLAIFATCLALGSAPAMAQSANRSWTGDALRYTPSTAAGCNVALMEAASSNGFVFVTLRNGGTGDVSFTLGGELAGNGDRSIGTTATRLAPGRNVRVQQMRLYNGSLAGSVLTLRGSACSVLS